VLIAVGAGTFMSALDGSVVNTDATATAFFAACVAALAGAVVAAIR
jgi:hypothetical protein